MEERTTNAFNRSAERQEVGRPNRETELPAPDTLLREIEHNGNLYAQTKQDYYVALLNRNQAERERDIQRNVLIIKFPGKDLGANAEERESKLSSLLSDVEYALAYAEDTLLKAKCNMELAQIACRQTTDRIRVLEVYSNIQLSLSEEYNFQEE